MAYAAKDFSKLLGMEGFSNTLLNNHFTLYQGYVTNTNKLIDTLMQHVQGRQDSGAGIRGTQAALRVGIDGMRLHEYYFENLGGKNAMNAPARWPRKSRAVRQLRCLGKGF